HVWDMKTSKVIAKLGGHEKGVWRFAFSADGATVAVAGKKDVRVWDVKNQKMTATLTENIDELAFDPADRTVFMVGVDRTIRRWNPATGKVTTVALEKEPGKESKSRHVALAPDLRTIATSDDQMRLTVWDTKTGKQIATTTTKAWVWPLLYSADGKWLAGRQEPSAITLWAVTRDKEK